MNYEMIFFKWIRSSKAWASLILFAAAGAQFAFFLILARALGADEFGVYMAVLAFIVPLSEFGGLGAGDMAIREVSRAPSSYKHIYYSSLLTTIVSSIIVSLISVVLVYFFIQYEVSVHVLLFISFAEVCFGRLTGLVDQLLIGLNQANVANVTRLLVSVLRALYGLLVYVNDVSFYHFSLGYCILMLCLALVLNSFLCFRFGKPCYSSKYPWFFTGYSFAFHHFGRVVGQTMDRLILIFVLSSDHLGVYNAGARVLKIMIIPLVAVTREKYAGFFEAGKSGIGSGIVYARNVVAPSVCKVILLSFAASVCFSIALPYMLGRGYEGAGGVGIVLSVVGVLVAVQYVLGDVLTCSDYQLSRTVVTTLSVLLNGTIMYGVANLYGLYGALAAFVFGQCVTIIILFVVVKSKSDSEKRVYCER